jgi:PiT family inorganic phosphate transporter
VDTLTIVIMVVALALFFDFTNGFHDTANAMATPIATGALKPRTAVAIASVMNLIGAFLSTAVATMISVSMINDAATLKPEIIFAGLTGAILWNLATWFLGLPSSSSHALFGGLIGAVLAAVGLGGVNVTAIIEKILIPALFAPVIAGLAAWLATRLAYAITARSSEDDLSTGRSRFKVGQIFSSSLVALSHGTNDAQKTMGVITLVLVAGGIQKDGGHVELWVVTAAALAIALGTFSGGWRIIKTMGKGLSEVKPAQGLAAEVATAATILASSKLGFALSTTQVASGSIIGSGLGRKGGQVRWGKAGHVVLGWIFTLPAAAIVGAISAALVGTGPVGIVVDAIVTVGVIVAIFQIARRNAVTHKHVASELEEASEVVLTKKQRKEAEKAAAKAAKAGKGKK